MMVMVEIWGYRLADAHLGSPSLPCCLSLLGLLVSLVLQGYLRLLWDLEVLATQVVRPVLVYQHLQGDQGYPFDLAVLPNLELLVLPCHPSVPGEECWVLGVPRYRALPCLPSNLNRRAHLVALGNHRHL